MPEVWDVTVKRNRPKGDPHSTMDTLTYRVHSRTPAEARQKALKQAARGRFKDGSVTIIGQDRVK